MTGNARKATLDGVNAGEPEEQSTDRPAWARWITIASLVIAGVALVFTIEHVGFWQLEHRLGKIGLWFGLILVMEIIVTMCDSLGLRFFLRASGRIVTWPRALLAQVAGKAINIVTPSGSLGDVVKFAMLVGTAIKPAPSLPCFRTTCRTRVLNYFG